MRVAPSVHYSMGGLWVDLNQQTSIPGLFAAGECDFSQHGANRLGANSLLSAVYAGSVAGPSAAEYVKGLSSGSASISSQVFDQAVANDESDYRTLGSLEGPINPYALHEELGALMTKNVTVVRNNKDLAQTLSELDSIEEKYHQIGVQDHASWSNTVIPFVRQLGGMIDLAKVITKGALNRNESRGSHYKPEFPERNDADWLKTTLASYNANTNAPDLSYETVDISLIKPRKRDYSHAKKEA